VGIGQTAVRMARTKNQARTAHTGAARRLTEVNGREGSRVGTTTEGADGEEVSSATSSERSRRAARRGKAPLPDASMAADENGGRGRAVIGEDGSGDMDSDSGDCHMTPAAGGICSENYYTALEGEAEEDSAGEPSEAPSIKSPHKPRRTGPREGQVLERGAGRRVAGGGRRTDDTGPSKMESGTTGSTRRTGGDRGQPSTRKSKAGRGKEVDYMVRIRPTLEALLGNVEELLLGTADIQRAHEGRDHSEAPCPGIVGMLIHGQEAYAKVLVGGEVHTREQSRAAFDSIQWIADRRKTKADTEERALQEKLTRIFRGLKEMILKDGDAEDWKRRAWSFGEAMKDLLWFMDTVDTGVDIANYPRTQYHGSLEARRHGTEIERPNGPYEAEQDNEERGETGERNAARTHD